jgi:hypothetical protein
MTIINSIIQPLRELIGINHFAYHRYRGAQAEAVSSSPVVLEYCLQLVESLMPVDLYNETAQLLWSDYLSSKCMLAIKDSFNLNPNGVTFLLKHSDGFSEHIAFATRDHNLDLRHSFASDPQLLMNAVSHVRRLAYENYEKLDWLSYNKESFKRANVEGSGMLN